MPPSRLRHLLIVATALGVAGVLTPRAAHAQLYTQCPKVNVNTGCGALITIGPGGVLSIAVDPMQGPYDDSEDALIGVVNNSGMKVNSLTLITGTDAFAFDDDGICTFDLVCTWAHPTGYEGATTSFTNINDAHTSGTIVFAGGLAPGATAYFSLEETPASIVQGGVGGTVTTVSSAPEPATFALVGAGLGVAGLAARRKRNGA